MTKPQDFTQHSFSSLVKEWEAIKSSGQHPDRERGMAWLEAALQTAIQLEFSTIPPYLCALWSIKDSGCAASSTLRHIVQEEMLHMALTCNLLVALGDDYSPRIAAANFAPRYPTELPGGVHEGLEVRLEGLSDDSLATFLAIELPGAEIENVVEQLLRDEKLQPAPCGDVTIGELYDCVGNAFATLRPKLHLARQVTGPLAWATVTSLDDVHQAISLIKDQGEGSSDSPLEYDYEPDKPLRLSHFFRFLELKVGKQIVHLDDDPEWGLGETLPRPDCYPMAPVPAGGYAAPDSKAPNRVRELCNAFNNGYILVLQHLDRTWRHGDQGELVHAIEHMFALKEPAQALMKITIKGDEQERTYGPDFSV